MTNLHDDSSIIHITKVAVRSTPALTDYHKSWLPMCTYTGSSTIIYWEKYNNKFKVELWFWHIIKTKLLARFPVNFRSWMKNTQHWYSSPQEIRNIAIVCTHLKCFKISVYGSYKLPFFLVFLIKKCPRNFPKTVLFFIQYPDFSSFSENARLHVL